MRTTSIALATVALGAATAALVADPVCRTDEVFDVTTVPILPFGGEIIGAGTLEGTIAGTRVDVTFTATDLLLLLAAWGDPGCAGALPCEADVDGDGAVGVTDLLAQLANWGDHFCASSSAP